LERTGQLKAPSSCRVDTVTLEKHGP